MNELKFIGISLVATCGVGYVTNDIISSGFNQYNKYIDENNYNNNYKISGTTQTVIKTIGTIISSAVILYQCNQFYCQTAKEINKGHKYFIQETKTLMDLRAGIEINLTNPDLPEPIRENLMLMVEKSYSSFPKVYSRPYDLSYPMGLGFVVKAFENIAATAKKAIGC